MMEPSLHDDSSQDVSLLPSNMIISGQFNLNTGVRMISEDGGLPLVIILSSTEG